MSYSVCTIRIRPIRAEGLVSENGAVENPLIVAQVLPWKTTRKSKPLAAGGANPSWKGSDTYLDLPYFGHPLPGVRAYVALMLMDKAAARASGTDSDSDENEDEDDSDDDNDISAEMARNDAPVFVGRADFDLRRYLQRRHDVHTLRLSLMDKKGSDCGEIVCTLQFVLTGVVRLTVLSGSRLKSNVQEYPDQEPYAEAYLLPGKGKKKRTNHKSGENPRWGEYTRQPSLLGFASLGLFKGNEKPQAKKARRQPHILDFKFKDNDRSEIPRIMIAVKDKMDTVLKQENAGKREREQIQKLENRIRQLKLQRAREKEAMKAEVKHSSGGWFFSNKKQEPKIEDIPLSGEESALVSRLAEKMEKQRQETNVRRSGPSDRLIGTGLIDIRPILNYDGVREAKMMTIDLVDENNMETGTLTCMLEFDNFAFDRTKEILKLPEFEDFTWAALLEMNRKQLVSELHKVYLYSEVQMEFVAPDFVIRAADQSGLPKTFIMSGFVTFSFFFLATLWLGLGTRTLSYSVGVLYPVFQSYKALEKRSNEMNQQWLTYWIVYGCISALEGTVLRPFTFLYPTLFYVFKMMILLWLVNPNQLGATMLYHLFIAPWMRKHEGSIDKALSTFQSTAREAAKDFAGIYDQLEEEMMMIHLDANKNNLQYNNSPTLPEDDPFGIMKAVKRAKRASKKRTSKRKADASKGTRIFVALEEQKDNAKMVLLKPDMSWEDVCLVAATTLGIAEDVNLYMNINGTRVNVNGIEEVRENDLLFIQLPEKVRMQWVEKTI